MRKVILFIAQSLDGYIASKNGNIDWLEVENPKEEDNTYDEFYKKVDTIILGNNTYTQIVNELSPTFYPYENKENFVFTNRDIKNTKDITFTNEAVSSLIKRIKKEENKKDIWIVGGNQIIMPLVKENLIDEYIIATIPILLGSGISLFTDFSSSIPLELLNTFTKNEMIYSHYKKK